MANNEHMPGNLDNNKKLPGSGGKNPLREKELDILDPEAKPEDKQKKGLGDIIQGAKKAFDKVKKIIDIIKMIPAPAWPWIILIVIIIFVITGFIGFFTLMPGLLINALKEFAQGAIDTVESWFTTEADAYINTDDVIKLANYLEEMDYDLVGYGFVVPNSKYSETMGYKTVTELKEEGYVYFEKRGDDENSRYYSQTAEEDPEGNSAYDGYYYNSLGKLIDNSDGSEVGDGTYIDQYGIIRSTEETSSNGKGEIVSFADDWLGDALDVNVDTTLLRTYLLSDYRIYSIRNNDEGLLANIYATIKQTFGGYDSAWSKGLLKFYYSENGVATSEWSDGLVDWIKYGDDIEISRTSTGATLSVKNGHFNNPITFEIDGWADRYGLSLEFLLSLHIATMQPDLVYAILQNFDMEVQVYLDDSGDAEVEAQYVDMMNENVSTGSGIELSDIETAFSETGHGITSFFANNNIGISDWIAEAAVTKKSAKDVYDYINNEMGLSLESPPNCTGQAQDQVIVLATDDTVFGWRWASTNSLNSYGLTEESEATVYNVFDEYEEYYYYDSDNNHYIMSVDNCDASLGTGDDAYLSDTYSYFEDEASGVNLADYGYEESTAIISEPVINEIETTKQDTWSSVYTESGYSAVYDVYTTKEVIQTRTYSAEVDGEEVEYEWQTYKYLIYKTGTETQSMNYYSDTEVKTTRDDWDESDYEWVETIVFEFIIRDKTTDELVDAGLLEYDETIGDYIAVDPDTTKCSDDPEIEKCCANCKKYLKKVMAALAQVSDSDYKAYTPYIARVLGSWFRDTYFVIPENIGTGGITYDENGETIDAEDYAILDYIKESERSSAELEQISNSYGYNGTYVKVDEEYLADTGEYWTAYEMTADGDYQLYYLNPNGTTSDTTMEEFLELNGYSSQEEAEEAGHAFVKKAKTSDINELSTATLVGVLWSAYGFDSNGAATGWIKIEYDDENEEVNNVYDIIGDEGVNDEGGFYYNLTSTNSVTQEEDAQRSQTNATIKWLFKYRKYYTYDGTEETAELIAEDEEAVLEWAENYLKSNYSSAKTIAKDQLSYFGRSALRQAYEETILDWLPTGSTFDWEDVTEQWLEWQLDMYYSGIVEDGAEQYFVLDDLAFIVTKDDDGNIESISSTTNLDYTAGENEEVRIGDPRNPDLISTTNITKTSLEAFTILENTKTLAAEYAYRDFKELIVELDYFDKEDLSDAISEVFTWVLPELSPTGWPVRPWDKQDEDYGALIESKGTYQYLKEKEASDNSDAIYQENEDNEPIIGEEYDETDTTTDSTEISASNEGFSNQESEIEVASTSSSEDSSLSQTVGSASIPSTAQARVQETYTTSGTADIILNNINKYGGDSDQQSTISIEEIKSLGGIFEKYADYNNSGKNNITYTVETVEEFQEVNEYVFGLMTIFGFDYSNSNSGSGRYISFGAYGAGSTQGSAIFGTAFSYYGSSGTGYEYLPIEEVLSKSSNAHRTNCNVSADMVYYAAGILPMSWITCNSDRIENAGGTEVTSVDDLQVSDIIVCYDSAGNFVHVKWVGEIDDEGNITVYDGGSYYINRGGDFKAENQNEDLAEGLADGSYRAWHVIDLEESSTTEFEGYEGGEYVSSPVTGKVLEYGTHLRTNTYTGETEEVGYIVIEAISSSDYFTSENVANNSGDTEDVDEEAAATGLNLFYDEYEETCAGYIITIDGFDLDLNTTDEEGNNGTYEQNEVMALYNSDEQRVREEQEQQKDDAPFFVNIGESADLGNLPDTYECSLDGSDTGYYIKEGKYLGKTYTDEEAENLPKETTDEETDEEYTGPANYIRIIVKDLEYSIIDNVEDYFDIPDPTSESSTTGVYGDLEAIDENSTDVEKVRAAMSYYISQGFTAEAAAGILGNAIQESALDPTANNGSHAGLYQWDIGDRYSIVTSWMTENGYNEDSFAGQIRASYESGDRDDIMTAARWETLKNLTNINQATELFCVYYEGAVNGSDPTEYYNVGTLYQELNLRKRYAQNAYNIYMGADIGIKD